MIQAAKAPLHRPSLALAALAVLLWGLLIRKIAPDDSQAVAVMTLLSVLAGLFAILTSVFPEKVETVDASLIPAIHQAVGEAYPEARITNIQEVR